MKFLNAEYLFLLSGLCLLVLGYFNLAKEFGINMLDTYFVIAGSHLMYLTSAFFILIASIHFLFTKLSRPLNLAIGLLHYTLTLAFAISFLLTYNPLTYYSYGSSSSFIESGRLLLIATGGFVIAQLLFVGNMIWALLKSKVSKP
jgi:heme/copper-type cytochrome/quinol oxidase subunit 1